MNAELAMEILNPFCATKDDPFIPEKEPFAMGGYTYANNGFILIRVVGEWATLPSDMPPVDDPNFWTHQDATHDWKPLPTFDPELLLPCRRCKGIAKVEACDECDGSGEVEWETIFHSYSAKCKSCRGYGVIPSAGPGVFSDTLHDCVSCSGTGKTPYSVPFGKYETNGISSRFIDLLSRLTGIEISTYQLCVNEHFSFRFDGGEGIVMPMVR